MRILGIDPGTLRTGWGVVETSGSRLIAVDAGVIRTRAKAPLADRLLAIHRGLVDLITDHAPDHVAVEDIFFAKHANAALKLGHVRGVALLTAAQAGIEVTAYPPALVKKTLTGRGRADKDQIARIVAAILGLRDPPAPDAADALAIAVTHAQARRVRSAAGL